MSNKNVRLSFEAWKELRKLKFSTNKNSYTETLKMLLDASQGKKPTMEEMISSKKPSDNGDISKSDKTIVIDDVVHSDLASYKQEYLLEHDATARGPGAISISQIIMSLISQYKQKVI